jgi:CPA1 family monovalent cation:H+ antiporter
VSQLGTTETTIVALLVVAALVAIAVSYLRVPYTVALVVVGLGLSFGARPLDIPLTDQLIVLVFLPPLLFEGAINMDLDDLRLRWAQVTALAVPGTAVAVGVLTGAFWLIGVPPAGAFLLGVILAPTDPVSVLAIFKEHGIGAGLRTLMEGEAVFNDAVAIVLYVIAREIAAGAHVTVADAVAEFGLEVIVGVGAGALVGFVGHRLMRAIDNHLVETTLSLATAYGAYLLADRFGGSGVIATIGAGLLIGNYGTSFAMSDHSRVSLTEFWEVMAFIVNSLLFLLLGLSFHIDAFTNPTNLAAVAIGVAGMFLGRVIISYAILRPFARGPADIAVPPIWRHAVFWGGLRGAIPVALALGLPPALRTVGSVDVVATVFGVVFVSLLAQGSTYRILLARLGLIGRSKAVTRYEEALAQTIALRASTRELESMYRRGDIIRPFYEAMKTELDAEMEQAGRELAQTTLDSQAARDAESRRTARRLAAAQRAALNDAARRGVISNQVVARHQARVDEALAAGEIATRSGSEIDPTLFLDDE